MARCTWFAYRLRPLQIVCARDKAHAAKKLAPFGYVIHGGRQRKVSARQMIKVRVIK